jgi:hypothetical protein
VTWLEDMPFMATSAMDKEVTMSVRNVRHETKHENEETGVSQKYAQHGPEGSVPKINK